MKNICSLCGCSKFTSKQVLWPDLCKEWEISEFEISYINKQQGHCCDSCGSNMRSRILGSAIITSYGKQATFQEFINDPEFSMQNILEINHAGSLHKFLSTHSRHRLVEYPQFDMMYLDIPDEKYDLIVHSDTLEHIPDPLKGMKECYRVLKYGGKCFYTIPIIVDRMTRSRKGMTSSYHGSPQEKAEDYLVHTEFGCDAWRISFEAGFKTVKIYSLDFPSSLAFELEK